MLIDEVARHWFDEVHVERLGVGHIHDTYLVTAHGVRYVLQRVNQSVFTEPELVMQQTRRVLAVWSQQTRYKVPELVASKAGLDGCWVDGQYYRVWRYIEQTRIVEPLEERRQAFAAGAAFGALQAQLAQLPDPRLEATIAGFLQLDHYLQSYDEVASEAPRHLQALVDRHRDLYADLQEANTTIHGDCKINNLLFDEQGVAVVAIIDFDTAMFGHWAWDFGDLVRSVCFSAKRTSPEFFAACLQGFAPHQQRTDVASAVAAPCYVTLMLGIRFLTDHLRGDAYFRVSYPGENLQRAQEQFDLFASFRRQSKNWQNLAEEILADLAS
ncbi:MAG: phosphotransferase enzyme family protein [bacterium]